MAHELLQFFAFEHLPPHLRTVSEPFGLAARTYDATDILHHQQLAVHIDTLPENLERAAAHMKLFEATFGAERGQVDLAMRRLLEAKDCAVRALVYKP